MSQIESFNVDYNDDGTFSYRIYYKPDKKKSTNGGEQLAYADATTGSAETIEEIFNKIKSGKDNPKKKEEEDD